MKDKNNDFLVYKRRAYVNRNVKPQITDDQFNSGKLLESNKLAKKQEK